MHWLEQGAYTGETSAPQLKALGVTHVLIGHSERRQYFNETDESVNLKLKAALKHGLVPIVCVGELLAEREANQTTEVLERQTSIALGGITAAEAAPLVIAYEPVWAIGTGKTATPEIADDAHKIIRAQIAKSLSPALAASTRILYGGSVKPDNTSALCCLEDIDGALVGGASLEPASFAQIVTNSAA
jgi:triosephosphate isomerase